MPCFKRRHAGLTPKQYGPLRNAGLLELLAEWERWSCEQRYPKGVPSDLDGEGLELVDTEIGGCLSCFFHLGGNLDAKRQVVLRSQTRRLRLLNPRLRGTPRTYFEELLRLGEQVERYLGSTAEAS